MTHRPHRALPALAVAFGVTAALAGCSTPEHGVASDAATPRPALTASRTLAEAEETLHRSMVAAIRAVAPKGFVFGSLLAPDPSAPPCAAGTGRQTVSVSRSEIGSADIGPALRDFLAARGWTFGDWTEEAKPRPNYLFHTEGALGRYRIRITYRKGMGQTDVFVGTPCLPGTSLTQSSPFPEEVSTQVS